MAFFLFPFPLTPRDGGRICRMDTEWASTFICVAMRQEQRREAALPQVEKLQVDAR